MAHTHYQGKYSGRCSSLSIVGKAPQHIIKAIYLGPLNTFPVLKECFISHKVCKKEKSECTYSLLATKTTEYQFLPITTRYNTE